METSSIESLIDLPFDQYQRYRKLKLLADRLREIIRRPVKILDIGGYLQAGGQNNFCPAQLFLPNDDVYVLDIKKNGPGRYVAGSGLDLPFKADSFDLVSAMDTLEHIPAGLRPGFIQNICHVSHSAIMIAGPVSNEPVVLAEKILDTVIYQLMHIRHPALVEHIEYGLPQAAEIQTILNSNGLKGVQISDGFLPRWLFMMIMKHFMLTLPEPMEISRLLDRFYNMTLSHLDDFEPSYRQMFVYFKKEPPFDLESWKNSLSKTAENPNLPEGYALANLMMMLQSAKVGALVVEKLNLTPSWIDLKNLAEERLQIINQKDDMITRQLNIIAELQNSVRDRDRVLQEKEHVITGLIRKEEEDTRNLEQIQGMHQDNIQKYKSSMEQQREYINSVMSSKIIRMLNKLGLGFGTCDIKIPE